MHGETVEFTNAQQEKDTNLSSYSVTTSMKGL